MATNQKLIYVYDEFSSDADTMPGGPVERTIEYVAPPLTAVTVSRTTKPLGSSLRRSTRSK